MNAPARLRIDFVSDVVPVVRSRPGQPGTGAGEIDGSVEADIHLQPFELNPQMPFEGEDAGEHIMHKYDIDEAQLETNRAAIRDRAAPLGVAINTRAGSRVWNTFDAHRLLHWTERRDPGKAVALKQALFRAYFTDNQNVADRDVLVRIAQGIGLDGNDARRMLESGEYAGEVRAQEQRWQQAGIHSVPATVVNGQYLIPGGQPPEVFENALREIATKAAGN